MITGALRMTDSVFLGDDNPVVSEGVKALLEFEDDFEIVGQGADCAVSLLSERAARFAPVLKHVVGGSGTALRVEVAGQSGFADFATTGRSIVASRPIARAEGVIA